MSYPIESSSPTGATIYAIIHHPDGRVWNTDSEAWEAFNPAHWTDYAIALTEQGASGYYRANYPAGIVGILTTEATYNQAGGSPAIGDAPPMGLAQTQGVNISAVDADSEASVRFRKSLTTLIPGAVITGTLEAAAFSTDITDYPLNAFLGRSLYFDTGDLAGQGSSITGYDPDTGIITVAGPFTGAPAADDIFIIA